MNKLILLLSLVLLVSSVSALENNTCFYTLENNKYVYIDCMEVDSLNNFNCDLVFDNGIGKVQCDEWKWNYDSFFAKDVGQVCVDGDNGLICFVQDISEKIKNFVLPQWYSNKSETYYEDIYPCLWHPPTFPIDDPCIEILNLGGLNE